MTDVARAAAGCAAAALWVVAAWSLLRDAVPGDLTLPPVDVDATFGAKAVADARSYERFLYVTWALSQAALLVALAVYARRGAAFARHSAAGRIGTGMLLGMLGLGVVWLVQLPFGAAAHWWARRHDTTEMGYLEWVFDDWLELGASFLAVSLALVIVMALAGRLREWWWVPGAAAFVGIAAVLTLVSPYLSSTEPLRDNGLVAAARGFEREQGVAEIPLRVEEVSGDTSDANAYATGLGPTRRVVLWDTLLDGRFDTAAEKTVVAHEIAHHSSLHLGKALAWFGLFALPAAWILMRVTRSRGGMARPEAVPLALLAVAVIQLVAAPFQNEIGRRMEAEADWKALASTRDPAAARRLFVGFSTTGLGDPSPPTWAYLLLASHPSLAQRVAMADAWRSYSAQARSSMLAISSPIASDDVAPGDGALRTCTTPSTCSITKSSTSVPSDASACARIPESPGRTSARVSSGISRCAAFTNSLADRSRTVSPAPVRQ
jgi:STE24 endopeptidase